MWLIKKGHARRGRGFWSRERKNPEFYLGHRKCIGFIEHTLLSSVLFWALYTCGHIKSLGKPCRKGHYYTIIFAGGKKKKTSSISMLLKCVEARISHISVQHKGKQWTLNPGPSDSSYWSVPWPENVTLRLWAMNWGVARKARGQGQGDHTRLRKKWGARGKWWVNNKGDKELVLRLDKM